jgi:hypothetical protein
MLKRAFIAFLLSTVGALAQPLQPANITTDPSTTPEVVQVLDRAGHWAPMGTVDSSTHIFTSVGGGGPIPTDTVLGNASGATAAPAPIFMPACSSALIYTLGGGFGCNSSGGGGVTNAFNGFVNALDPSIGMQTDNGFDNSPLVDTLNNAMGPFLGRGYSSYEAVFPGKLGQYSTNYYFTQPLHASRSAKYSCVSGGGSVRLWFAPGVDGIIQDQGGSFEGCQVASAGQSLFWGNALSNNIVSLQNYSGGLYGTPPVSWHVGDGFMAAPLAGYYPVDAFPPYPMDTVVTSINGGTFTGYIDDGAGNAGRVLTVVVGNPGPPGGQLTGSGLAANTYLAAGTSNPYTVTVTQKLGSAGAPVTMTAAQTLTVSNPASPYLGATSPSFIFPQVGGQPPPIPNNGLSPAKSTATFTQTGNNNFNSGDTINVAGVTYTMVLGGLTQPHQVLIGPSFDASAANIVAAVMNTSGQWETYVPSTSGRDYYLRNQFVTAAHVSGSGVIAFTSIFAGPIVNTFPSVYTVASGKTPTGAFGGATFTGGDDATTCPSPCLYITAQLRVWQLPASVAFHITTAVGNNYIGWSPPVPMPIPPALPLGFPILFNGDKVWSGAFPFGTTVGQVLSAALFVENGTNNFHNGDTLQVGNNTFTFRTALTAAAGDILIGVDFPTSLAHLNEGIQNSPAGDRGVIFNPPTNVSNVSISGSYGPTWATFHSNAFLQAVTNAFPAIYTPSGTAAGSFTTGADFSHYVSASMAQPGAGGQIATKSYAPGAEGLLWIIPTALKKRVTSNSRDMGLNYWGIGESMICSAGWGFNCDLSRDERNFHQYNLVGRWAEGDNYSTASSRDEQYSDNFVADDLELGTLGESVINPNYESTESGTSHYGGLVFCGSQNATTIDGGYIGGGNYCSDPVKVIPGLPFSGMASLGLNAGSTGGSNFLASTVCCNKQLVVKGGNDGTGTVTLGGGGGTTVGAFGFDPLGNGATLPMGFGFNTVTNEWTWTFGIGTPSTAMQFRNSGSTDYSGSGAFTAAFPPGVLVGGDGSATVPRLFGMSNNKPTNLWHLPGDFEINIGSSTGPGSMGGWYSVGGSSQPNVTINGTLLSVNQEVDPTPAPTIATGGSGYASGANVNGTMTGNFAGCTTQPVLPVTASGATGAIISVNAGITKGVCPPPASLDGVIAGTALTASNITGAIAVGDLLTGASVAPGTHIVSGSGTAWVVDTSQTVAFSVMSSTHLFTGPPDAPAWTPGGALLAGTGASFNAVWEQALAIQFGVPSGPPGLHQLLVGTGIVANTHIISVAGVGVAGNYWTLDQTYGSPIGPEIVSGSSWYPAMAISNDPTNPDFTATTLRSGAAANKDLTGRIALVGGVATYTLTGIYASPPNCITADATTPANANSVLESTTVLTFSGTGTDTLKWICAGRN